MPFIIALPIILRLAASAVFIIAVVTAGAMNRPLIMVPLLAAASTGVHWLTGRIMPSPMKNLQAVSGHVTAPGHSPQALFVRFIAGTFGYGLIFMVTVFMSAIFRETELDRMLTSLDGLIIAIPAVIAGLLSIATAYTGASQVTGMAQDLHQSFTHMRASGHPDAANDDAFTVEGEIIDPDDLKS